MEGKCFLATASFLQSNGSGEAAYRSAVSRAYYACFLEARQIVFERSSSRERLRVGVAKLKMIRHEKLPKYLKQSECGEIRRLGVILASLCVNRTEADYNMEDSLSSDDSQDAIDEAQSFLDDFSQVDPAKIEKILADYINKLSL